MINFLILMILIIAYLKIYISFSKFFKFKKPFNYLERFLHHILIFEIITILVAIIFPNLNILAPTIIHFIGTYTLFFNVSIYSIIYIMINILLIITSIDLNDNIVPIYNFFLALHFLLSASFTIYLFY